MCTPAISTAMLTNIRGTSPLSEAMSEGALDVNRGEKALLTKTPTHSLQKSSHTLKNYSDKNGNDVSKKVHGRKTFAFWALVTMLFVLSAANLIVTFSILAVLRLGQGMESMELLPEDNSIKFFGETDLDNIYKRDGLLESFRDVPLNIESYNGSIHVNLQTRLSRTESKLTVNRSGVFVRGVESFQVVDPEDGEVVFGSGELEINVPDGVNNLEAKQISTKRIAAPLGSDLAVRAEGAAWLRGAEGTRLEARDLRWTADQDVHLRSINGSIILSGKEGVYIDVKYLPIAIPLQNDSRASGQYKLCVCMPQGKLFRVAVTDGQKVLCSRINMSEELNPCT